MKVTSITFMQTFPTGDYKNQRLGIEIAIDESDSIKEVFEYAKAEINQCFHAMNPNISPITDSQTSIGEVQVDKQDTLSKMISDMLKCTSIDGSDGLESHRKWVYNTKDDGVIGVFESKLKQLNVRE